MNKTQILDETKQELKQVEITIQELKEVKDKHCSNSTITQAIDKSVRELETQKEFLIQLYDDDKQALEFIKMTDEQRHQSIADMKCFNCGEKLYCYAWGDGDYCISCENCSILFSE